MIVKNIYIYILYTTATTCVVTHPRPFSVFIISQSDAFVQSHLQYGEYSKLIFIMNGSGLAV